MKANGGQRPKRCFTLIRETTLRKCRHIIALGGGGFAEDGDLVLERYILDQARTERPSIGFIPTATGDADVGLVRFYAACVRLACQPSHLDLFKRTCDLREWVFSQDVIFVGGGNTKSMIGVWREWALDEVLREAWEGGVVLSGVSAGAICWFDQGSTDSYADRLRVLDCLGFLPGSCCPHYDTERERRPTLKRMLQAGEIVPGIALDNDAAAHFVDTELYRVVTTRADARGYELYVADGEVRESTLSPLYLNPP